MPSEKAVHWDVQRRYAEKKIELKKISRALPFNYSAFESLDTGQSDEID